MSLSARSLTVVVVSAVALAVAAGVTSARSLGLDETSFRLVWANLTADLAGVDVECEVTLTGSFHGTTFAKTAGLLVGSVTNAIINEDGCVGGRADPLEETLPWHVRYAGFAGTLPGISSITVSVVGMRVFYDKTADCLVMTTAGEPFSGIMNLNGSGVVTSFAADAGRDIQLLFDEPICELIGDASFSGTASVSHTGGGTLEVTLI